MNRAPTDALYIRQSRGFRAGTGPAPTADRRDEGPPATEPGRRGVRPFDRAYGPVLCRPGPGEGVSIVGARFIAPAALPTPYGLSGGRDTRSRAAPSSPATSAWAPLHEACSPGSSESASVATW